MNRALIISFSLQTLPSNVPQQVAIKADSIEQAESKLADLLKADKEHFSVLYIDSLDAANHEFDTQIRTEFSTYHANTQWGICI